MKTFVCIAAHNEGDELYKTVEAFWETKTPPYHFYIALADGYLNPHGTQLQTLFDLSDHISVRTFERPAGAAEAKHAAVEMALSMAEDDDIIVVADAHIRPPLEWGNILQNILAEQPRAIIGLPITGMYDDRGPMYGLRFTSYARHDVLWARPDQWRNVPGVHSAFVAATAETWRAIGGYAPGLRGYGGEELWIGVRGLALSHPVLMVDAPPVRHLFADESGREAELKLAYPATEKAYNKAVSAYYLHGLPTADKVSRRICGQDFALSLESAREINTVPPPILGTDTIEALLIGEGL